MNTDTDTSVFENHTGYWILVFSFCTGQVSDSKFKESNLKSQNCISSEIGQVKQESYESTSATFEDQLSNETYLEAHLFSLPIGF